MGQKIITFSDLSGNEIENGSGGYVLIWTHDKRRGSFRLDVTLDEFEELRDKGHRMSTEEEWETVCEQVPDEIRSRKVRGSA